MSTTICNQCELLCGLLGLPTAAIPADNPEPLPGLPRFSSTTLPDIRQYCREHYIKPAEK